MDQELKALIDSTEFKRYHKELQAAGFNPFDVLQVADREIRHSNVLAWLLRPGGTHGIGGRFLRALVEHLTLRRDVRSLSRLKLPLGFDDEDNVEVRREDYHEGVYADITVGFKAERLLLIIENKVGPSSRDAELQLEHYQKAFGKKYKDRYDPPVPGVLLTTSNASEAGEAKGTFIHVSWNDVGGIIRSLLNDRENFTDDHVRAFVERYLDVIEEKLVWAGSSLAERLLKEHEAVLVRLQEQPSLLGGVEHAPHRQTVKRLMEHFEGRSAKLREQVEGHLERRSSADRRRAGPGCWLHWYDMPCGRELKVDDCAWWYFTFEPRHVFVELGYWSKSSEQKTNMDKIWTFLRATPIDPDRPERYPMEKDVIYRHSLLKDDELSGSFEEVVESLRHRMDEFFGGGGDHQRIERYFKCLAFDPGAAAS